MPAGIGSATVTPVAPSGPLFAMVNVQVTRSPRDEEAGVTVFTIARSIFGAGGATGGAGGAGGAALTVTSAVSLAVTSGPTGGWPVAVAVFVNGEVTPARVQVYEVLAPLSRSPMVFAHFGASASVTVTL